MSKNRNSKKKFQDKDATKGSNRNSKRTKRGKRDDADSIPANPTADNDISWWNGTGQIYLDATNISTYNALGAKTPSGLYTKQYYSPTGIARYDYAPYFGDIYSSTHPINATAKIMYDVINSKNSRNPSYNPNDLMIYIIAVAQAWSLHAWVRRLIGMYNTFSVVNRYWWVPICTSMGIEPINVDNDVTKWRNLANYMSLWLNRLAVPDGICYFKRAQFMNENIYMDSPVGKASYYYFSPASVLKYTYDSDKIGQLVSVETPWHKFTSGTSTELVTPKVVQEFFLDIISNLFNDDDINTMGADIVKAFGMEHIYSVPQITPEFSLGPQYSPEVNLELHNARLNYAGNQLFSESNNYTIYQDMVNNTLATKSTIWEYGGSGIITTAFIASDVKRGRITFDFPVDNPGNDLWMLASRFTWLAMPDETAEHRATIIAGTEMLIGDSFWEFTQGESADQWELGSLNNCSVINFGTTYTVVKDNLQKLARVSKLHDAPIIYGVTGSQTSASFAAPMAMEIISDLTNYSTIAVEDLINMHDAAQISVFLPEWLRKLVGGKGN